MDRRTIYEGNKSIEQVLIQWDESLPEGTTGENLSDLEDKVLLEDGRNDTNQSLTKTSDDTNSSSNTEHIPKDGKQYIDHHDCTTRTLSRRIRTQAGIKIINLERIKKRLKKF